jgi:hypothetical protein
MKKHTVKNIIEEIYKHNDTLKKPKKPLVKFKRNWDSSGSVKSHQSLTKYIKPKEKLRTINLDKIQR